MKKEDSIKILNSWSLTHHGIITELSYDGAGLPKGIEVASSTTKNKWSIEGRMIFNHTMDKQTRFPNEHEIFMHFSFRSLDKIKKSIQELLDKEDRGIYQYILKPIGHLEKPLDGEQLEVLWNKSD